MSVKGVNPGVKGVNPGVQGVGLADCATAVEDEVFEEEESAESEGGPARPCHPVCDRGRRIQPAEREPRRRPNGDISHAL